MSDSNEKIANNSVYRIGDSLGVTLPKTWAKDVGLDDTYTVDIFRKGDTLIIKKGQKKS